MHLVKTVSAAAVLFCMSLPAAADDRPRVVTVNYPLQYFAERLLGDAADVAFPIPQDIDPSFWRPTIADISAIQSSDLILLNGAGFATWVDRVSLPRSKLVNTSASIEDQFIITESITHSHGDGGEHSHEGLASYVWLDPMLALAQAEIVASAISTRQLAPAQEVEARLADLRADLQALDRAAEQALAPLTDDAIIATHPRYQYLARRYGLSISALEWEAGARPSEAQLDDLQGLVQKTGATILIWEGQPPNEAFEAASALGLRNVVFPTMAHRIDDRPFDQAFADAIADLSGTASR